MTLNLEAVGREVDGGTVEWTSTDAILYALGVGAGADPIRELEFTTENSEGIAQRVLPTFPVVLGGGGGADLGDFSMTQVLHAEQTVELFADLPAEGRLRRTHRVAEMLDKGKDALIRFGTTFADVDSGAQVAATSSTIFVRGEGGFGGERGTSTPWSAPAREPDHVISFPTRRDQALLYRLSGDRNPLHSDPAFAARAGFAEPILHGLCGYGFTGRALLQVIGGDPSRFGAMSARFASPVLPGEEFTVRVWSEGDGSHLFEVSVAERVVLTRGAFRERAR